MNIYFLIFTVLIGFLFKGAKAEVYAKLPEKNAVEDHRKSFYDIAVLNIDKILHESKSAKQLQIDIEAHRLKFQEEMKKHEENFAALERELIEQQKTLKPEAFAARRKEFEAKVTEVHQMVTQRREQLEMASSEALGKIQETILVLVRDMTLKRNYKLVVPQTFVIFREDGLEITDEIMKELDLKLPSVSLKYF